MAEEKFTHKVDPRIIHADQRKQDTRRDAWDRDYMPADYVKPEPETKKISNAAPVFVFAFFYVCILVMIGSIK
jgi:hypothetical protein